MLEIFRSSQKRQLNSYAAFAVAPLMRLHISAHRRHSCAQGPQRAWCDACCSHTSAHRSHTSAQKAHRFLASGDTRLIHRPAIAQISAHSRHSLIQRSISCVSPL